MAENKPKKSTLQANPQAILQGLLQNDIRFEITIAALTEVLKKKCGVTEEELVKETEVIIEKMNEQASQIVKPNSSIVLPGGLKH